MELEIPALVARAEAAIRGEHDTWLAQLGQSWEEGLGIGLWSDILYYSFH